MKNYDPKKSPLYDPMPEEEVIAKFFGSCKDDEDKPEPLTNKKVLSDYFGQPVSEDDDTVVVHIKSDGDDMINTIDYEKLHFMATLLKTSTIRITNRGCYDNDDENLCDQGEPCQFHIVAELP